MRKDALGQMRPVTSALSHLRLYPVRGVLLVWPRENFAEITTLGVADPVRRMSR